MECPYCKAENRDGVRYCGNCGKMIAPVGSNVASARLLTPGSRLQGGRYIIKRVLGQGGMGAAMLATDNRLDSKLVVIKELISDNTDPTKLQDDVRNFKREVATLAHIDHPLVPNVTDHFQEGTRYFMVQEYVEGENLEQLMERVNQPMRERDALVYISQTLDVLDYLAQQTPPIVHRDIKPANSIIGAKDKRAHLVDFGIARADAARKQTTALGTPGYAPPEQYQGNADPRSDLYALAATLHYLLTNRDPRNHPPFIYPQVRLLNPQLSAEIERVLTRALNNDVNQRYQSAAAMKQDIDDILQNRFGISGSGNYVLGTSGPMSAIPPVSPAGTLAAMNITSQSTLINPYGQTAAPIVPSMTSAQQPSLAPVASVAALGGAGTYGANQGGTQKPRRNRTWLVVLVVLLLLLLVFGGVFAAFSLLTGKKTGATVTPIPTGTGGTNTTLTNGIGVTKVGNEYIGISDGTVAFDTTRAGGDLMSQAATKLKSGDVASAESLWQAALASDTGNAEALIYLENQRVLASGRPYITLVVATMLTGDHFGVGRDDLQGAYIAQKAFNDGSNLGSVRVRLLIANTGNSSQNATQIAQQLVQAAQSDKTIVGVMGWPFSSYMLNAVRVLTSARIPMVSQTASSDDLTGVSPYFFRVAPSNSAQATIGARYAFSTLGARNVTLFVDQADSYSRSLASDFTKVFTALGGKISMTEQYTVGKPDTLPTLLGNALNQTAAPDLIYFAGYSTDVSTILTNLPSYTQFPNLKVMGGDALYSLSGYPSSARAGFNRLRFTAFAYPDQWSVLGLVSRQPSFFTSYIAAYDPNHLHTGNPYGYTRADNDVILSYDATVTLLKASGNALGSKTSITTQDVQQALIHMNGKNAIQGVSGQISFGANGDPVDKSVVILYVDPNGFIKMEPTIEGKFLLGS